MMHRFKWIFVILAMLLPTIVHSDEWSVKGSVDQNLSYDDNVLMQSDNTQQALDNNESKGSFKYMIVPLISFQHKTDASEISANASYGTQIYTEIERLNQEFQNYSINSLFKAEQFDWGIKGDYSETPTRNRAVIDSGDFTQNSSRTNWSVSPYITYIIDDIDSISFTPSYTETSFTNSGNQSGAQSGNFFNPSKSFDLSLAWQRLWSERYKTGVSFFYSHFDSLIQRNTRQGIVPTDSLFDNYGINFSNTYLLTDNWRINAVIGGRYTESDIGNIQSNSLGFLADASIEYTGENFNTRVHFNRGLTPSSFGQLQEQTSVGLNFSYRILEKLSASLTTQYQESTIVNSIINDAINSGNGTRENFVIEPSIHWQLAKDWTLGGSYRYRTQSGQGNGFVNGVNAGDAESNLFMISINYNWQGINITR